MPEDFLIAFDVRFAELDVADSAALARAIAGAQIVLNCAAVASVDEPERSPSLAYALNAGAVASMAHLCRDADVPLLHLSTDYVFDGAGERPWRESDRPAPINVYGASKLAGEQALALIWHRHLILRISWVFGASGRNVVRAIFADRSDIRLEPVASGDVDDMARRPLNAVLDCPLIRATPPRPRLQ